MHRLVCVMVLFIAGVCVAGEVTRYKSRHYEVVTDMARDDARELSDHMDKAYAEYRRRFSDYPIKNSKRPVLHLYETRDGYLEFLASKGINGSGSGGMFFRDGGDAVLLTFARGQSRARVLHTLRHEGFHQFSYIRIGDISQWLDEGLAEYFGEAIVVRNRFVLGGAPSSKLRRLRAVTEAGLAFDVRELLTMSNGEWNARVRSGDPRASVMYDQSWSLVHFLINGKDGRYLPMFEAYIKAQSRGLEPMRAFRDAFGTDDVESLEEAWREYLVEQEPDALSTARERLAFLGAGLRVLHEEGVTPSSIEELRDALRDRAYEYTRRAHGVFDVFSASQDELFEPPPSDRKRKTSSIELVRSTDPALPPGVRIDGLSVRVELTWQLEDGELIREVTFR